MFSKIFPFADFLHILQLEDYYTGRYLKRLNYFFFRRELQRLEQLKWTTRTKLTLVLAIILTILGIFLSGYFYLFFLTLLFYFAYNKNGPKILWFTLLTQVLAINLTLQITGILAWQQALAATAVDYLSLVVFGNLVILAIFIAFSNKSSIPNKGRFSWLLLILSVFAVTIIPVETTLMATLKILFLFSFLTVLFIPVWVALANFLVSPVYALARLWIFRKAEKKLRSASERLKVVAVVGSYGKTTTKNFINQLLQYNYRLQMIPGNINTSAGIAKWILANLEEYTDILLVEADGYDAAEYSASGRIVKPDYVIITNVGDQHLERFGTRKNLAKSMLKLAQAAKPGAQVFLSSMNVEDLECWEIDYLKMLVGKEVVTLDLASSITYEKSAVEKSNLSTTNQINLRFALQLAEQLEVPVDYIKDTIPKLELPERRQEEIQLFGYQTLDDSYNISLTTAKAGLEQATKRSKELKKKLVVIFGGIPELGSENSLANREIATLFAKKADAIVLLNTIIIDEARKALEKAEFVELYTADKMVDAWLLIQGKFSPKTHYVLMQPELNDLYYEL